MRSESRRHIRDTVEVPRPFECLSAQQGLRACFAFAVLAPVSARPRDHQQVRGRQLIDQGRSEENIESVLQP